MSANPPVRTLARRAIPAQARSAVTVEKILNAATSVLVDRGLQSFNTNSVAQCAGLNVATLYHYFPDKVSILAELFTRDQNRRSEFITARMDELPHVADLSQWTSDLIHAIVEVRRANPATAVLRQACRTVPELVALEESDNANVVTHFARILRVRIPELSPARSRHCARALIESGAALLDRASLDEESAQGLVRETITMLSLYLGNLATN